MTQVLTGRRGMVLRALVAAALVPSWLAARAQGAEAADTTGSAEAAPATTPGEPTLQQVEVRARHYDNAVGSSDAASQGVIRAELLKSRPAQRPGEVLEFVPGVVVTQHSGDGKANQYFLRGFNLDHGTDFATSVNGLPVNMPTHGHGQGYADLNFLIPELVQRIEYRKGPYFARNGDFSAAGSADIAYRRTLDEPFTAVTLGERGYRRLLGAASTEVAPQVSLLAALELQGNDGPWTVDENLRRRNAVLTLSGEGGAQRWSASLMAYDARWTSTDQIPQRLADAGTYQGRPFGRFDSLDPSDGGNTSRYSLCGQWERQGDANTTRVSAYAMDYRLKLWSNFTYALERPDEGGDQFSQQDSRRVFGLNASHAWSHDLFTLPARSEVGLQLRHDRIGVGLFNTVARQWAGTVREDDVRQTQLGFYGETSVQLTPRLRAIAGLRADQARFKVASDTAANTGTADAHLFSPKFSLVLGPWEKTEFFVNAGRGFHSNDARGTTDAVAPVPGLVASRGWELGVRSEWLPGLQASLALWTLSADSELVYVGDAGATEANRPSRRRGVEWNNRWTPRPWLLVDADLAWTHARFTGADPQGLGDHIPNAVDRVAALAVTLRELGPWSASVQWRYRGSGPLVEDNSVRSQPSPTTNLRVARQLSRKSELTLDVFNLTNRRVNDIEYFYESRLPGEAAAVADRHVHPAEPRTVRVTWRLGF